MIRCSLIPNVVVLLTSVLAVSGNAADDATRPKLKVVATHSALGSIAEQVGGNGVEVVSLCRPTSDVHSVEATPSVLARLADADVLLHSGLDLELWLEDGINGSRNLRIRPGAPGNVDGSTGIAMLNVPSNPTRADGDVHLYGNPHYWMDPLNARTIAATIAAGLGAVDPSRAAEWDAGRDRFVADLNSRLKVWLKKAIPYKNTPIVCFHDSFPYFARRFGLQCVGFVEPKPRIPPTQAHLQSVITLVEQRGVKVLVREPFHDPKPIEFVAEKTGAKVITLGQLPGWEEGTATYQDLIERDLDAVLAGLK